ncbi:uncharacterized protein LOC124162112 isoform X2 [Ischnura elegans]|uniref:uncharacterized protein LOC124162112 isoform X2 n=1 Tax=Ischnura elegans TaxID=197161 RepID=UPI001ED885B2|nr:uncharacterized protein LOC124162112 isoform X2 [Ischnura elegans]
MAKEMVAGETVGAIDDDGPEEGEIEDDTSEEDGPEKKISSNPIKIGSPMEVNFYQPPSSSKTEPHVGKSKAYSEDKKIAWRSAKRRIYRLYVDHDKPTRDSYNRLTKSDLNSDHREINFQDLLKDYRTSKHGNEGKLTVSPDAICFGNSHEKENRHFTKEARTDTSRKHESEVIESQEEKLKRNRKRKQHRSPSRDRNSSVSSDTDGVRKRKDPRNIRQRRNWKTPTRVGNLKGSAALFAQIRASKLNALSASVQQKTRGEGVPSYIDITAEVSEPQTGVSSTIQPVEGTCEESRECTVEVLTDEGPLVNESSKSLCSASDSQTAERNEDSESKDEEDDVNQLRMLALQSAFRAKYLERKRRGMTVRKHSKRAPLQNPPSEAITDLTFNLDDTADLLEAAVEEAVSSSNKETAPSAIENWQTTLFSSLSEVPLPPDDPPVPSPVEDLTPVDMELALTDEEENANPCPSIGNDIPSDSVELLKHRLRTTSSSSKARSIPVTIGGRTLVSKPRKRMTHTPDKTRCNLLEVTTCISRGEAVEEPNSTNDNMVDMNMGSMLVLDAVGTCSSPENGPHGDDDHALSEVSDTKSDLVSYSNSKGFSGSIVDDEDEEILRARLLVEISRRHRRGNIPSNTLKLEETKDRDAGTTYSPVHEMVSVNTQPGNVIRPIGKSLTYISANLPPGKVKVPLKRSVERTRRGQLLAKVRNRQVSMQSSAQVSLSPYAKTYLSKVISRGKYHRVNQNRLAVAKKRIDGNLHVTVMGPGSKSQSLSTVPQQQDRIVICLGEDSEESDDDRQPAVSKRFPQGNNVPMPLEKPLPNPAEIPESLAISNVTSSSPQLVVDNHFPTANISADFEKSVDRFLKEVRSGQESRLQDVPPSLETRLNSETIMKKKVDVPVVKLVSKSDVTSTSCRVTSKANVMSVVPKAALRSNAAPATPKVAANAVKSKPTNQIVKTGNGVTPQAVRHLPPPQQEEYRRLKMQISVLEELHKKRKAAEILHASRRNEVLNQGKGGGSTAPSSGPKLKVQVSSQRDPNCGGHGSSSKGSGESLGIKIADKPLESVSALSNSLSGDDVEEEDVNLLREQLLRSRLQKKMNAMAETSVKISETSPVPNQGIISVPVTIVNPVNVPHQVRGEGDNSSCAEPVTKSSTATAVASSQGNCTSTGEGAVGFSDIPDTDLRTFVTGKKSLQSGHSSVDVISESAKCGKVEADASKGSTVVTKKTDLPVGDLSQAVENVSLMAVSQAGGVEQCHRVGGGSDGTSGNSEVQAAAAQTSHVTSRTAGTGALASSASFPLENQDTRASELAELEFQLLSERHAALQHLSELSGLLSKMEIEGAHLRQKEIAAQKLRAELAAMESSIAVQKDFLKQLALTISSTHERVTSTRQRCSMLCHSCTKLGNQLKQDKRANGGKIGTYQVPTGGAALVKSQLSSVLWQTKQLKKSGLPFLRGQNFVASGKVPTAKRLPRQTVAAPVPWSSSSTLSLDSLKISSSDDSVVPPSNHSPGSAEIPSISEKSAPVINRSSSNDASSITKTLGSSGVILPSAPRKLSSSQGAALPPEKPVVTTSSVPGTNSSESSAGAKVEELKPKGPVNEVPSTATTSSSQSVEDDVSRPVNSSPAVPEVILSQSGGQEPVMSVSLRDYHSPLEPITKRINAEVSCPSNSSQQEESMTLDPNVILCPYDLMGECQDEECNYQHQRRKGMVKGS